MRTTSAQFSSKHIVLFGYGYVASRLAERLIEQGARVTAVRRSGDSAPGVVTHPHDLSLKEIELPESPDAAVFSISADSHTPEAYQRAYVTAVKHARSSLEKCNFRGRFIFVSSTGVYAQNKGELVDEASPAEKTHFSGQTLLEGERAVCEAPFESVILRLSAIYGPGRMRMIDDVKARSAVLSLSPHFTNRIHREDCARIIEFLLGLENPERLYIGSDEEPADKNDVLRWIAKTMELPEPPDSTAASRGIGKRCSSAKVRAAGFQFQYPTFREGYGAHLTERCLCAATRYM